MKVESTPEFGSYEWLKRELLQVLSEAREESTAFYEAKADEEKPAVDFDTYSFIDIDKRKRRLWRMLAELERDVVWLHIHRDSGTISIEPKCHRPYGKSDPWADQLIAERLCVKGIPASQRTYYRD